MFATSAQCFYVLHDRRGLSVHFMLDVDGTIYQTLDVKERAWHATKSNDRSIGIEIANLGAYPVDGKNEPLSQWYKKDSDGQTYLIFPKSVRGRAAFENKILRPRRNEPVIGAIREKQYQQYTILHSSMRRSSNYPQRSAIFFPRSNRTRRGPPMDK